MENPTIENALQYYALIGCAHATNYESVTSFKTISFPPDSFVGCLSIIKIIKEHDYQIRGIGSALVYRYMPDPLITYRRLTHAEMRKLSTVCYEMETALNEKGLLPCR